MPEAIFGLQTNHYIEPPTLLSGHTLCDFFLFKKSKEIIKGKRFLEVDDIKTNVTVHIKSIKKRQFEECSGRGQEGWQNMKNPWLRF